MGKEIVLLIDPEEAEKAVVPVKRPEVIDISSSQETQESEDIDGLIMRKRLPFGKKSK